MQFILYDSGHILSSQRFEKYFIFTKVRKIFYPDLNIQVIIFMFNQSSFC